MKLENDKLVEMTASEKIISTQQIERRAKEHIISMRNKRYDQ